MFKDGWHLKAYQQIIEKAKARDLDGYVERHHVVPRSLGGTDDPGNIVRLTAREHFTCHRLLVRMTEGTSRSKMLRALWFLAHYEKLRTQGIRMTSKAYALLREEVAADVSRQQKGRPWPKSEEAKQKMREAWERRRLTPVSDETRAKISQAGRGKKRTITPEHAAKISAAMKGKPRAPKSAETREKMSASQRERFKTAVSEETRRRQSEAQHRRRKREAQAASIA